MHRNQIIEELQPRDTGGADEKFKYMHQDKVQEETLQKNRSNRDIDDIFMGDSTFEKKK